MYETEDSIVYTRDEIVQLVDEETRRRFNISAEEFARAVRLRNVPADFDDLVPLLCYLGLLEDDDPIYGGLPRIGAR